ncbi:hypothetical protein FQZ97_988400 [compost metagenome]
MQGRCEEEAAVGVVGRIGGVAAIEQGFNVGGATGERDGGGVVTADRHRLAAGGSDAALHTCGAHAQRAGARGHGEGDGDGRIECL